MRKDRWGKNVRRMEKKESRESLRDLKKLDGVRRRGLRRGVLISLLLLLIGGAAAFYFAFDVGSWQTLDMHKLTEIPQTGAI